MKRAFLFSCAVSALFGTSLYAQSRNIHTNGSVGNTVITTSVPFLGITPDARAGAMGDLGAATSPDVNTMYWNCSKLAFLDHRIALGVNYTPWLHALVHDISLSSIDFAYKVDKYSGFGASMRYFSIGDITFTDDYGHFLQNYRPYEMALDAGYARKLSSNFSIGIAGRFIYSNLAGHTRLGNGSDTRPGFTFAADISGYYTKPIRLKGHKGTLSFGGNISNIGGKITYTSAEDRDFIPINLRLGTFAKFEIDQYNEIGFGLDLNKLLVPSNPIYKTDASGAVIIDANGNKEIAKGMNPNVPVLTGMIHSFYDAPGGFSEEISEIDPSIGIEYWYDKTIAGRLGYFYEAPSKGDRQYLTVGMGFRFKVTTINISYLIPTTSPSSLAISPLANTFRFSLLFNFDNKQ